MHKLDLSLYSHPKEFWGNGVRTHVISKGKIPFTGNSEEDGTHDTASHRTVSSTHQGSYSSPLDGCRLQSLEFVTETRILAEMKIKNRGKKFSVGKKSTSIPFSVKIKTMDL